MSTREDSLTLAVPAGWKLIPLKCDRAIAEQIWAVRSAPAVGGIVEMQPLWDAMLAAAPTPPAAEAPGQEPVAVKPLLDHLKLLQDICVAYLVPETYVRRFPTTKEFAASRIDMPHPNHMEHMKAEIGYDRNKMFIDDILWGLDGPEMREAVRSALVSAPPTYADAEAKGCNHCDGTGNVYDLHGELVGEHERHEWVGFCVCSAGRDAEAKGWQTIDSAPTGVLLNLYEPHEMGGYQFIGIKYGDGRWGNNLLPTDQHNPTHWALCRADPVAIRSLASPAPKGET